MINDHYPWPMQFQHNLIDAIRLILAFLFDLHVQAQTHSSRFAALRISDDSFSGKERMTETVRGAGKPEDPDVAFYEIAVTDFLPIGVYHS